MSEYEIEYCPWCGGNASTTTVQEDHAMFKPTECEECDTVFRVSVPHKETELKWSTAW